jgi:hypothetical protein
MIRLVIVASLFAGCRISLENSSRDQTGGVCAVSSSSQPCLDAVNHSDLAWIEKNVFAPSCDFPGCHNGAPGGPTKVDLRAGMSYSHLVNVASHVDPTRKLVVPNDAAASYLLLMLRSFPPDMASPPAMPPPGDIGFMPQNGDVLCCQKLDAVERWVNDGAPTN